MTPGHTFRVAPSLKLETVQQPPQDDAEYTSSNLVHATTSCPTATARGHCTRPLSAPSAVRHTPRVVRAAPNNQTADLMRAAVLRGVTFGAWEAGPRSAAELNKAAAYFERAAALCHAPAGKVEFPSAADWCRRKAEAM